MHKLFTVILILMTWFFQSCSPLGEPVDKAVSDNFYFDKSESDIIYSPMGNWFELGETALNAHSESFEVLNAYLGKDKQHSYYKWYTIPPTEIDHKTFDASYSDWMWHVGMDQHRVYAFDDDVIDGEWQLIMQVIEGADPETYEQVDYEWSRDKNNHFYRFRMIAVLHDSFEVINETFARDRDSVYLYYQNRFERIDAESDSFRQIDRYYAMDSRHIYFFQDYAFGKKIERLEKIKYRESNSIKVLEDNFLLVDDLVFYRGTLIEGANRAKLNVISGDFAKDDEHVYYGSIKIDGADPETFKYDDEIFGYKDKFRIYDTNELDKRTSNQNSMPSEEGA